MYHFPQKHCGVLADVTAISSFVSKYFWALLSSDNDNMSSTIHWLMMWQYMFTYREELFKDAANNRSRWWSRMISPVILSCCAKSEQFQTTILKRQTDVYWLFNIWLHRYTLYPEVANIKSIPEVPLGHGSYCCCIFLWSMTVLFRPFVLLLRPLFMPFPVLN